MKNITINDTTKLALIDNFKKYIETAKFTDNTQNYIINIPNVINPETPKATVYFTEHAYLQMMLYVRDTATEIAWHGVVRKLDTNKYCITDTMLYPQYISGATVNTEQDEYNKWIESLDDNTLNTMRFQGHSHVNFGVTPSGVDMTYYKDILSILPPDDFYIFMIMNKSGDMTLLIYDLAENILYENADINRIILKEDGTDLFEEIKTSKTEMCKVKSLGYKTPTTTTSKYGYPTYPLDDNFDDDEILGRFRLETDEIYADLDRKYKNTRLKRKK